MNWVGVAVFALTYLLISARRVGRLQPHRPTVALAGALACIVLGVVSPRQAMEAVDLDTLWLLLGVMGMAAFLVVDGVFDDAERRLAPLLAKPTRLLGVTVWGAGGLAAFITNDAVCVLGAPLFVRLVGRAKLPYVPFLIALATGANTGSVATLVGNPQNMLCGQLGDLEYVQYLATGLPIAVLGLAINHAVLHMAYAKRLTGCDHPYEAPTEATAKPRRGAVVVIAITALAYGLGASLAATAMAGFGVLCVLRWRDVKRALRHIDFSLLGFFAGLFVVVEGLRASGATDAMFGGLALEPMTGLLDTLGFAALVVVGSNLVSNVPLILVIQDAVSTLGDPAVAWTLIAVTSTFAGNMTLLGSAANIIVAESSREVGSFGFWEHLRVGLPIAVLTSLIGVLWIWLLAG